MLQIINLSKVYPDGTKAVDGISFEFKKGKLYSIIGPSGCGKSTFLLMISGLLKPTSGRIFVNGKEIRKPYNKSAVVLQNFGLLPWKTVYENVALGLKIKKMNKKEINVIVENVLKRMGLWEFRSFYPAQLSGGMRQKVAFGRVIALNPEIVFLDEPLSSLDALSREKMQNFLLEMCKKEHLTAIIITHSIEEAAFLGEEVLVFSDRPARLIGVVKNEKAGSLDYRETPEFFLKCKELRGLIV